MPQDDAFRLGGEPHTEQPPKGIWGASDPGLAVGAGGHGRREWGGTRAYLPSEGFRLFGDFSDATQAN